MYWWLIFWIWVIFAIVSPLYNLFQIIDGKNKTLAQESQLMFIIIAAVTFWISISILVFLWQHLTN